MFFFGVKKERKNLWGDASPKPRRPWRSGARGQLGLRIKRGFVKFGQILFSFYSSPRSFKFQPYLHHTTFWSMSFRHRGMGRYPGSEANRPRTSTPRPLWRNLVYLHKHKTNVKCEMNSSALHLNT